MMRRTLVPGAFRLPYRGRLLETIRSHPKLASLFGAVSAGWRRLVEAFCATIDPYLSKYFPDLRLVVLMNETGDLELLKIFRGTATPLGTLATLETAARADLVQTKWTAIELRLPPDRLLHRVLSLPAASRDFLAPIIQHRLERLTPWHPDRVLYGFRPLDDIERNGNISVALTATSKEFVAASLEVLGAAGLAVTAIGSRSESSLEPLAVNLLRDAAKTVRLDSRRMVSRIALVSFGLLVVAFLVSSLWAWRASSDEDQASGSLIKARRLLVSAGRDAIGDRERIFLDSKRPEKAVVVLISKLADAIPTNTFLKELAITQDKVRLAGLSGDAPALVRDLEIAGLVNVRFTAAVTREKDQRDRFEITADRSRQAAMVAP